MSRIDIETNLPHKPEDLFDELCQECGLNKNWFENPKKIKYDRGCFELFKKSKYSKQYRWNVHSSFEQLYVEKRAIVASFLKEKAVKGFTNYGSW